MDNSLRLRSGVRVIVNGAWGFASSPLVTEEEIARVTAEAVIIAKANSTIQPKTPSRWRRCRQAYRRIAG
jgi:predicted Zn-dependent protease